MPFPVFPVSALAYLWVGLAFVCFFAVRFKKRPRYPPGPKGLPIVGNFFDVPSDYAWITYGDLGRQYGSDIIHLEVFGSHIVALNSAKAVKDLLEKRSSIYSDREQSVMLSELTGWGRNTAFMKYGDVWKEHRRLLHQYFRPLTVPQYHSSQAKNIHRLLQSLLDSPEEFVEHIQFLTGATILDVVYAFDVRPGDPMIELVEKAVRTATEIMHAGVYLGVYHNSLQMHLRHLPSWFPGAGFKRQAAEWKTLVDDMHEMPYGQFKASMRKGHAEPCFTATLLSADETNEDMTRLDEVFMSVTGAAYAGGADTTAAGLATFLLAVTMFPQTQVAAHEELDRVLGRRRLPEIEDRESLPHITAILHEVMRWHPTAPLGIPHRTTTDDDYQGYHIPAGTVIFGNAWAILHNEDIYPDPEAYKPERYLNEDGGLRDDIPYPIEAFGYGRRICPGRHFAHDILWQAIANILTVFKIERALDNNGNEIVPKGETTPHLISTPKPFKCRFTLRFPGAETLIRSAALTD
ncbi:uncharacterized protein PHACADRAFT_96498 [Phanerochaete carnosa HHB-10118-sp]|uniref:Cytochrome P450 n=1 Tax=Phanerochaete carnosa (strain HHB-10118-sp) TaxID=650164 RepID=K5VSV7_PHACS|nr:uncharacterized protein PHACADRAFT_96498 [Phanerochaete carnosa HHB-10118-sp]EKM54598.1 hypothetical protein PHACADRAFT_96498 [Phanerochaete carnosa HHB-10118-sp]